MVWGACGCGGFFLRVLHLGGNIGGVLEERGVLCGIRVSFLEERSFFEWLVIN